MNCHLAGSFHLDGFRWRPQTDQLGYKSLNARSTRFIRGKWTPASTIDGGSLLDRTFKMKHDNYACDMAALEKPLRAREVLDEQAYRELNFTR